MSNGNVKKYLKNGAISPLWQEIQYQKACDDHDLNFAEELARRIATVHNNAQEQEEPFIINIAPEDIVFDNKSGGLNNSKQELEDRFEFLKSHADNPEDLELAKLVLNSYRS